MRLTRSLIIGTSVGAILLIGNLTAKNTPEADSHQPTTITPEQISLNDLPKPNISLPKSEEKPTSAFARSYILMESDSNYPLAEKNADTPVAIASTTKIMTALVALKHYKLDETVTVSKTAATIAGSEIQLLTNEKMSVQNLLYALMLNSANDAAYALADHSGSIDTFVGWMNEEAQLLGLKNTHYKDPAGLNDEGRSTPRDLAVLMDYALDNEMFQKLVQTPEHIIWSADNQYKHELENSNRLIKADEPLFLSQSIGGKTGFTYEAGHCLVAAAEHNGKRYIAAVLNTNEYSNDASAKEARRLLSWAVTNVK